VIAGCLAASIAASPAPQQQKKAKDDQTIRIAVEMVSLPVVVTTRDGQRITDLKKEDFQVFEDGVPQEISGFAPTDEPISVALALDTSGSTEQKLAYIQNEAIHFVNLLHPDDSVAIMSFAQDVSLLVSWISRSTGTGMLTESKRRVRAAGPCFTRLSGWHCKMS
jgi:Ca-activated chloride channel family protein